MYQHARSVAIRSLTKKQLKKWEINYRKIEKKLKQK